MIKLLRLLEIKQISKITSEMVRELDDKVFHEIDKKYIPIYYQIFSKLELKVHPNVHFSNPKFYNELPQEKLNIIYTELMNLHNEINRPH